MPTGQLRDFQEFFWHFNNYLLKFTKHYQEVHILTLMYTCFLRKKIFKNGENMVFLQERPFFHCLRWARYLRNDWSEIKIKNIASEYSISKDLNEAFGKILIFTKITTILRKLIFRGKLISIFFAVNKKNIQPK